MKNSIINKVIENARIKPTDDKYKERVLDMICKSTPVARQWTVYCTEKGIDFADIEDDIISICKIEDGLYETVKETLVHHITLHGLDKKTEELFDEFKAIKHYSRNEYNHYLKKVRRAFVQDDMNRNLEYLLTKVNEYVNKVTEFGQTAFEMLEKGRKPDLDEWSTRMALQDALFEENKQFLKQTLNHLRVLEVNKYPLGASELRMLLYHRKGCQRAKLYRETEGWIIKIYDQIPEGKDKDEVYEEICEFVADLVPLNGYISVGMINFILDYGFLSETSKNLLFRIKPTIDKLGMVSLFFNPLKRLYDESKEKDDMSSMYVREVMNLYFPHYIE